MSFNRIRILGITFLLFISFSVRAHLADSVIQCLHVDSLSHTYTALSPGETSFLLSGKKMYEVAHIDGTFPSDVEKHVERGIWCHPVKLLSAIDCVVAEAGEESWTLTDARRFSYDFHSARFEFDKNGLQITRRDVIAEDAPALYIVLQIANTRRKTRHLSLTFTFHTDIRPSARCSKLLQDEHELTVRSHEANVVVGNRTGALVVGNGNVPCRYEQRGSQVKVEYQLDVPPHGEAVSFPLLIVGNNQGNSNEAEAEHGRLLARSAEIVSEKSEYYHRQLFQGVSFRCSDNRLSDAFYCAKANVLLNTCDHSPYVKRPFVRAGVPVYPRLFGTDFCFSVRGLLAGGFAPLVRSTLLTMGEYAREHLRAPHEISSDGVLLGWDHIQITPQWIAVCLDYYAWSLDSDFLHEVYPLCRKLLDDVQAHADSDGDGFPEGHGLMEESEFKADWEELSSASYLYTALRAVACMAELEGDRADARAYRRRANDYQHRFNDIWWNREEAIWNGAFTASGEPRPYHFWNVVFPQKSGVAIASRGNEAMERIVRHWVNDAWGMVGRYTPGRDQSQEGVGIVHNNLCATSAFSYGKGDLGWQLLKLTTQSVFDLQHSCLGLFPECQPGLCSNISQLWSYATFMESILMGLAGIIPSVEEGIINIHPFFPDELSFVSVDRMQVGSELISLKWVRKKSDRISLEVGYTGDTRRIKFSDDLKKTIDCRVYKI